MRLRFLVPGHPHDHVLGHSRAGEGNVDDDGAGRQIGRVADPRRVDPYFWFRWAAALFGERPDHPHHHAAQDTQADQLVALDVLRGPLQGRGQVIEQLRDFFRGVARVTQVPDRVYGLARGRGHGPAPRHTARIDLQGAFDAGTQLIVEILDAGDLGHGQPELRPYGVGP